MLADERMRRGELVGRHGSGYSVAGGKFAGLGDIKRKEDNGGNVNFGARTKTMLSDKKN